LRAALGAQHVELSWPREATLLPHLADEEAP